MEDVVWGWPHGSTVAVSLTFDVDAEAGWMGEGDEYRRRLTSLSEGRFGVTRGVPRILSLLERFNVPATFFVPGLVADSHRHLVPELLAAGHEVGHHGYLHLRNDKATPQQQRQEVEQGLDALARSGAPDPAGYRSPAWEMTPETFDLLVEFGFAYDSSCMGDDRPYIESWDGGRILELPVHWSLDDWPRFGWGADHGGNVADPVELLTSWLAEVRRARLEGRHVTFTMHPEVIGRAHRLAQLEALLETMAGEAGIWFARLDEVAEHVRPLLSAARS